MMKVEVGYDYLAGKCIDCGCNTRVVFKDESWYNPLEVGALSQARGIVYRRLGQFVVNSQVLCKRCRKRAKYKDQCQSCEHFDLATWTCKVNGLEAYSYVACKFYSSREG